MDKGETRNRIVPKKSSRLRSKFRHEVNAKGVPQNRTRKFGQFSPPLEADANADGRTAPAVKVALVLSAFVLAHLFHLGFHLISQPLGIRDQILAAQVFTWSFIEIVFDGLTDLTQRIPECLERSGALHVFEPIVDSLHGTLDFLQTALAIAETQKRKAALNCRFYR